MINDTNVARNLDFYEDFLRVFFAPWNLIEREREKDGDDKISYCLHLKDDMNYEAKRLSSFVGIFFFFGYSEKRKFSDYYYYSRSIQLFN